MKDSYIIGRNGEKRSRVLFGEEYILVACGTPINFNKEKVRRLLSEGISYSLNIAEHSLSEIHMNPMIYVDRSNPTVKNKISTLTPEDFLKVIE